MLSSGNNWEVERSWRRGGENGAEHPIPFEALLVSLAHASDTFSCENIPKPLSMYVLMFRSYVFV